MLSFSDALHKLRADLPTLVTFGPTACNIAATCGGSKYIHSNTMNITFYIDLHIAHVYVLTISEGRNSF
jgi:hypothetical protein